MARIARSPRLLLAALAAAVLVLAAACGGGGGSALPGGAGLVRADAAALVAIDTDFDGEQWQRLDALVSRLSPGGAASLLERLTGGELDPETELEPALGPETALVLLELSEALEREDGAPVVLLTQPDDPAALEALVARGEDEAVTRALRDGWYAVADDQSVIDRALEGAAERSLADVDEFSDALDALPAEAAVVLYLHGPSFAEAASRSAEEQDSAFDPALLGGGGELRSAGLALTAEADGFRIDGVALTEGAPEPTTYSPALTSVAPGGVLAFVSFADLRTALERFLDAAAEQEPDLARQLGQAELALGLSLEGDLLPLLEGEHALYVRPGAPIPEVTLLLAPADPQAGLAALDALTAGVGTLAGAAGEESPLTVTPIDIGSVDARQVTFEGQAVSLYYAAVDDVLVLTTAGAGIADLAAGGSRLADDAAFRAAVDAAGLPDESVGFAYVDLPGVVSLVEQLGALGGGDVDVGELGALGSLLVWASGEEGRATFSGFLGVE